MDGLRKEAGMPWQECSSMGQRRELVALSKAEGANVAELCRRFGISRKTGYKWLGRARKEGDQQLADRSRRPGRSPKRTAESVESAALGVRAEHPTWGGRKIRAVLLKRGREGVPAASTITEVLRRHGLIDAGASEQSKAWTRFEHEHPNDLWQMDFKGPITMGSGRACHPLTVLDDHSRYCVGLRACTDQRGLTVRGCLTVIFRQYGLPRRMLMDNGSPWGDDAEHPFTPLTVWLVRLGIGISHGAPYHPQTQGKDERFHRTLKAEVIRGRDRRDVTGWQADFDAWRPVYNFERPHEALALRTPSERYTPSPRAYPERPGPIEYGPGDAVVMVRWGGEFRYQGRSLWVSKAFRGEPVALRRTAQEHVLEAYYCRQKIAELDLSRPGRAATGVRPDSARGARSARPHPRDTHGRLID
jgi:transposase InsO family protein